MENKRKINVGDYVRLNRSFGSPVYGTVLAVDNQNNRLVIQTAKGNYGACQYSVDVVIPAVPKTNN